jgi:Endoplasmic reticulum-based factor for assembly of V-ATPase
VAVSRGSGGDAVKTSSSSSSSSSGGGDVGGGGGGSAPGGDEAALERSRGLERRRADLRRRAEAREYSSMTAGMGPTDPALSREGTFASYNEALGLGASVFVSLFTAAGAAYFAAQALTRDKNAVRVRVCLCVCARGVWVGVRGAAAARGAVHSSV